VADIDLPAASSSLCVGMWTSIRTWFFAAARALDVAGLCLTTFWGSLLRTFGDFLPVRGDIVCPWGVGVFVFGVSAVGFLKLTAELLYIILENGERPSARLLVVLSVGEIVLGAVLN